MRHELQKLYDSEINFSISTFWDGGFDWKLGDEMNGFKLTGFTVTFEEAVEELSQAAKLTYPDSVYAKEALNVEGQVQKRP